MYLHTFLDTHPHLIAPLRKKLGSISVDRVLEKESRYQESAGFNVFVNPKTWVPEESEDFMVLHNMKREEGKLILTFLQHKKEDVPSGASSVYLKNFLD